MQSSILAPLKSTGDWKWQIPTVDVSIKRHIYSIISENQSWDKAVRKCLKGLHHGDLQVWIVDEKQQRFDRDDNYKCCCNM